VKRSETSRNQLSIKRLKHLLAVSTWGNTDGAAEGELDPRLWPGDRTKTIIEELERKNPEVRETEAQLLQSAKMAALGDLSPGSRTT
jgi:C4-dicarboxylate-specific signal transduction histidine kinase